MGAITAAGTGSGLDLESIIKTFVAADRIPAENRLNKRELELNAELSGVGTLKAELDKFKTVLDKLSDPEVFGSRTVSFTDGTAEADRPISITTTDTAGSGSFDIDVVSKAQGTKLSSAALGASTSTLGSGNLTFGSGANSFQVAIAATDTLSDIRDKINNASDNFGVSVNIINSDAGAVLTFDSNQTGTANALTITSDDDSLAGIATSAPTAAAGLTETQAASDAQIRVNNQLVSSSTNKFTDVIQGSTIELNSNAKAGDTSSITIGTDKSGVRSLINEFVTGYNTLKDKLQTLSDPRNGHLKFDPAVRQISAQLSAFTSQEVTGTSGQLNALYDIGVTVNRSGKLEINALATVPGSKSGEQRLTDALDSNFDEITKLFSSADGIAKVTADYIDSFTKSKGVLSERQTSINTALSDLGDDRIALDERLQGFEDRLRKQYTALDGIIAQQNATRSYISSVLKPVQNNNNN